MEKSINELFNKGMKCSGCQRSSIKSACITLLILLAFQHLSAQVDSVGSKLNGLDSARRKKNSLIDSATLKLNTTSSKIQNATNHLTSFDTLAPQPHALQAALDKQKSRLSSEIDSLKSSGLPHDQYTRKLDSLNRIDPLATYQQQVQFKLQQTESKAGQVETRLSDSETKIQQLGNKPSAAVSEKLGLLSKESQGKGTLPSNVNLPDTGLPNTNLNIPKTGLPDVNKPSVDLNASALKKDINVDPKLDLPEVKKPDELKKFGEIQEKAGKNVAAATEKATGYGQDVKSLSEGNVDDVKKLKEDALEKASFDKEVSALKEGEQAIDEQKKLMESFKNPEEYRKQLMARGKEMAMKQMAARQLNLKEAMANVSKYQRTAGTVLNKKKDLPKRRDPLRKLKFYEKFVPGVTLQVQKPGAWLVDVNPSLRYRLTSYWSVGSGWNERVIVGKYSRSQEQTRAFGVRSFTEVILFKGLSMRLDAERINSFIAPSLQHQDIGKRKWVMCYMGGIKKDFTFMPMVTGNVQFMYNLYDPQHYRIYPTRFNVRFGFEFPLKKRTR